MNVVDSASSFDLFFQEWDPKSDPFIQKYGFAAEPMKVGNRMKLYFDFPCRSEHDWRGKFACWCEVVRITEKAVQISRSDNPSHPVWFPMRGINFRTSRNKHGLTFFRAEIQPWFEEKMDDKTKKLLGMIR